MFNGGLISSPSQVYFEGINPLFSKAGLVNFIVFAKLIFAVGKPFSDLFKWAKKYNVRVISEIELAYNFCDSFIIGVTGTNGKTTTTYLLEKVLRKF
ncbi:MAG TPA: hypothetical protein ENL27_00615, partial [Candidatus Parcubacteria bacterium]|nr:hypothetical protein [Candidatus Parcubacteria bacterium]